MSGLLLSLRRFASAFLTSPCSLLLLLITVTVVAVAVLAVGLATELGVEPPLTRPEGGLAAGAAIPREGNSSSLVSSTCAEARSEATSKVG